MPFRYESGIVYKWVLNSLFYNFFCLLCIVFRSLLPFFIPEFCHLSCSQHIFDFHCCTITCLSRQRSLPQDIDQEEEWMVALDSSDHLCHKNQYLIQTIQSFKLLAFQNYFTSICCSPHHYTVFIDRAVARPIIGGGGGGGAYSYIRVLPDGFLLKAIVFTVREHEYMNIHPYPNYRV